MEMHGSRGDHRAGARDTSLERKADREPKTSARMGGFVLDLKPSRGTFLTLESARDIQLVVGLLYDERDILKKRCIVFKSWVPPARKHLFAVAEFRSGAVLEL